MQHRRSRHPEFATAWDAALAVARPRIQSGAPSRTPSGTSAEKKRPFDTLRTNDENGSAPFRTSGGEVHLVRLKNGTVQVRRAIKGRLTREAEQAFLAALSATCNVSLAAAAVGAAEGAFHRRRRNNPAFAREMRLALRAGYERLEAAMLESGMASSFEHDEWRTNAPPAMPPMTANQALQLMYLHQKRVLMLDEPDHLKRRRGESGEAYSVRLEAMFEARMQRDREAFEVAEAERMAGGEPAWGPAGEEVRARLGRRRGQVEGNPFGLPDLAQVTGWSTADPDKVPYDGSRALFGGWRMGDLRRKLGSG